MFNWDYFIYGVFYTLVGKLMMDITSKYIKNLADKVASVDERFVDRLFIHARVAEGSVGKFCIDVIFTLGWPVMCIYAIAKAESEYDTIVRRTFNGRKAS